MHKTAISANVNQLNDSYCIDSNDGEFNVCIERDETRVGTAFYSPPFSRAVFVR